MRLPICQKSIVRALLVCETTCCRLCSMSLDNSVSRACSEGAMMLVFLLAFAVFKLPLMHLIMYRLPVKIVFANQELQEPKRDVCIQVCFYKRKFVFSVFAICC